MDEILVNENTTGVPAISASHHSPEFSEVWTDGNDHAIKGARFQASGVKSDDDFLVNVPGVTCLTAKIAPKRLELLRELRTANLHVGVLHDTQDLSKAEELRQTQVAARTLGIRLTLLGVREASQLEHTLEAARDSRITALLVLRSDMLHANKSRILEFATERSLPALYPYRSYVKAGGLVSYGVNFADIMLHLTTYIDKILKGTKPADLPVEQPTKFELVVNLRTAKALGLTIPPSVLARVDEVIQ